MHRRTCFQKSVVILAALVTSTGLIAQDPAPIPAPAPAAPPVAPPVAAPAAPTPATPTPAATEPATTPKISVSTQPGVSAVTGAQLISVTLDDVPLPDVVKLFTKISGANIIAATSNLQGNVTANLQEVAWRPAFEAILERQGLLLVEKPANSGIFVIEARRAGEEIRVTETVPLKFAKVDKITELLRGFFGKEGTVTPFPEGNAILLQATQQKITEARKVIEALDKPRSQVYIEARFVELSAGASKRLGLKWDSLKDWGVTLNNMKAGVEANSGEAARYRSGATENVTDLARPVEIRTGVIDYSRPLEERSDPTDPTSPVIGVTYPYYKDVEAVTDVKYPYLRSQNEYVSPTDIGAAPGAGRLAADMAWKSASGIQGQISASDFRLAMSAFEQIDGISIISNPKIIVANEEVAVVDMTTKEPYVKVTANRSTSGGGNTLDVTTELGTIPGKADSFVGEAFFSYGVTLKVTPRVSSGGTISVAIEPSLSEWVSDYVIPGANADMPSTRYPVIRVKKINTTFSMHDGNTAVIGGLTRSEENNIDSGIPYLRKIPYIGPRLFGWKSRIKDQKELVIFVTVGIVDSEKPIAENIGMPKNAVLTRDFKEPGDRKKEDLLLLKP